MAPGRLTLRLLGEIEVARGGERLALPASKKTRALLAYLAVTAKPQRRERLCQMFWDVPDDPRGALRWSLSKLRGLVDEPGRTRVVAERDTVALDAGDLGIDVAEARSRLAAGEDALSPAALGELAGLFRGEFLEGLDLANCPEFEAWRAAQREDARALHRRVLTALVERLADRPADALPHAAALTAVEPYAASSHLALLRLLAAAGRLRDAEKQYDVSNRLLAEASVGEARALAAAWQALRRAPSAAASAEPAAGPPAIAAAPPDGERPTVAVLPFANVGGSAGDEYFSQGISDEIAAELARFADLTILAPTTTIRVKDNPAPVPEIASKLRANYLLDGVVTRANQRMRMTARLLDGASGANVWAERFDRQIGDIFEVQDEITRTVAASLSIRLRDTGAKRSLKKRTRDLTAYDLMLRARRYVSVLTPEEHARARDCLEEAVRRDPNYADAHAALVYVYAAEYSHGHNPRPDSLERAMAAGRRALELDPQNPRAHASLALTHYFRRDDAIFASEAERALALNPSDPEMAGMLGAYFAYAGNYERGLALLTESMRLNPLHPSWYHYSFVIRHVVRGEIDEALARLALVDIQEFHWTLVLRAALLGLKGAAAEAAATYRQFRARYPNFDVGDYLRRWIRSTDYIDRILAGLAAAERAAAEGQDTAA